MRRYAPRMDQKIATVQSQRVVLALALAAGSPDLDEGMIGIRLLDDFLFSPSPPERPGGEESVFRAEQLGHGGAAIALKAITELSAATGEKPRAILERWAADLF